MKWPTVASMALALLVAALGWTAHYAAVLAWPPVLACAL